MDHLLEADTLPSARQRHSQTSEPDTPVTYPLPEEAGNDEPRIQSLRAPTDIAVHRLPMEIWIAVCEALRQLDLIDVTNEEKPWEKVYPELERKTTNKHRPDPIITAVSILPLSLTCRYLHKVTSTSLLETIRLRPPSSGEDRKSRYLSVMQQVKSLQLNSNQRLQHVRGFAVAFPHVLRAEYSEYESNLCNQICHVLMRFPNLHHLTVIGMALDAPLMQNILTLPLENLWLWDVKPDGPLADHIFSLVTTPRIALRSLVLLDNSWRSNSFIPVNWIIQLIGTAMRDLSFDASELVPPALPVLPDLEVLEIPATIRTNVMRPSILSRVLSKTPNLKEAALEVKAVRGDPANAIPALSQLERVVCHASWLRSLIARGPITTAEVLCDSQVRVHRLFEILETGRVPLRDLTLTYVREWAQPTWSPDDLESVARYLPELEILRLRIKDPKMVGLQKGLLYISQLEKLRIISFSFQKEHGGLGNSGLLDDVWQESKLKEFIGLTKSPVLERVSFVREFEWKLEDTGVWILWEGGRMVRSVLL